jgi:hypothetical protein
VGNSRAGDASHRNDQSGPDIVRRTAEETSRRVSRSEARATSSRQHSLRECVEWLPCRQAQQALRQSCRLGPRARRAVHRIGGTRSRRADGKYFLFLA